MKKCLHCNNDIPNRNIFCDNKCHNDYQTSKKVSEWLKGKNFLRGDGMLMPAWIRKFLLEESNYKCTECGWGELNPYSNTFPLEIDHIDGDSKNNLKENLRVLCPNCHSLKKTFKNTGKRKSSRTRNRPKE
jgi:rubredoxin